MAMLVNELRESINMQLKTISQLPPQAEYTFESPLEFKGKKLFVQKTGNRTVVSLNFSKFQAREVIRERKEDGKTLTFHSPKLMSVVPSGARYAYDLIAFVGRKSYLEGRKLKSVQEKISNRYGLPTIPFSSLYDLQRKFLFYLGEVHRQAAPRLKDYLQERGNNTWLIDGTIEPGSPIFFGVKEAYEGIFLGGGKIPTENDRDIANCLIEVAKYHGVPDEILHDLSERIFSACEIAFPGKPHRVCHYHLVRDIGDDLYEVPQEMLNKRLRAMKLQHNLKDQRSNQTQWLQREIKEKEMPLILKDLLNGKEIDNGWTKGLGREVLLGLHGWMLDYPSDGNRQGFPFDPYHLYFHRRIVIAYDASQRLFSREAAKKNLPKAFFTFSSKLENYLTDPLIVEATELYEKAFDIFEQIRAALRLGAKGSSPMHELYELQSDEQNDVSESLDELKKQFDESKRDCSNPKELKLYDIVKVHLEKYEPYLFPVKTNGTEKYQIVRTTNGLESHWSEGKRTRRQTHGRSKLTRDFHALPPEYMLIPNLNNPRYIEIVLGSLDQLPEKMAEAGKTSGPYMEWYKRQKPMHIGRLPTRLLRRENFIDDLINIFN
jgi:hypothetical protein